MIGAIAAGLVVLAVGLFVLWVLLYMAGYGRPKIETQSDVTGSEAMERKVLLATGMVVLTGAVLTVYGIVDPNRQAAAKERQLDTSIHRGVELYASNCFACHGDDGKGAIVPESMNDIPRAAPQLNRDQFWVDEPDEAKKQYDLAFKALARGRAGTPMPAWGTSDGGTLNQEQIHELASMIVNGDRKIKMTAWVEENGKPKPVTLEGTVWEVAKELCEKHHCKFIRPDDPAVLASQAPPELQAGLKVFSANGCAACHAVKGDTKMVGPSLAGISDNGAKRKPGTTAEDYIKESVRNPGAFVVPGFGPPSPMPPYSTAQISDADLDQMIKYLMSLK